MSVYPSTDNRRSIDTLSNVKGFDNAPAGTPYALVKKQQGGSYEPVSASSGSVAVDPSGGLELNFANQLRIKDNNTSGDSGLGLSGDGLEVVNRVKTAGDTMTGTLNIQPSGVTALVATPSGGYTTTIDRQGLGISQGGSIGVGISAGGPALDILQRSDISFDDGIRVRNAANDSHCQFQWDETNNFVLNRVGAFASNKVLTIGPERAQVVDPVNDQDVATKKYVDAGGGSYVLKSGDTMTGDLNMGGNLVRGLPTTESPLYAGDEATSWAQSVYLVGQASNVLVAKQGDTMTGKLTVDMGVDTDNAIVTTGLEATNTIGPKGFSTIGTGNVAVGIASGNLPDVDIRQSGTLPSGGVRIRNSANTNFYQLGWNSSNLEMHYTDTFFDMTVCEFSPTHIISENNPSNPNHVANKRYVDARKPLVTVYAEHILAMTPNEFEWSFGGGASSGGYRGYVMMSSGRVLRMYLCASTGSDTPCGAATVALIVNNGIPNPAYEVTKSSSSFNNTTTFTTPFEVNTGDIINFMTTASSTPNSTYATVGVLIELDL